MVNAKYAISVARQAGCCVFCVWEDIVEVSLSLSLTLCSLISTPAGQAEDDPAVCRHAHVPVCERMRLSTRRVSGAFDVLNVRFVL